jgi:hypothetical protein
MEARFSSVDLAKQAYPQVVRRIINSGVRYAYVYKRDVVAHSSTDDDVLLLWVSPLGVNAGSCGRCT